MTELSFTIAIKTQNEPSLAEIYEIMMSMKARLEGYHTEVPESMKGCDMNFDKIYHIDGQEKNIIEEIRKAKENLSKN